TRLGNANWLLASQPNSPNAFTGSVVVGASNSGALQINSGQSLGQAADTAVQSGGSLQVINTATSHVTVAQHLTLAGTGNKTPGALNVFDGNLTVDLSAVALAAASQINLASDNTTVNLG